MLKENNAYKAIEKNRMKNVMGGNAPLVSGDCGVKINGQWIRIWGDGNGSETKPHALELVGNGTATNWCCQSCSWNN